MSSFASATSTIRAQGLKRHSIWTLAAIGFLAYYITVMWHEIIGHGSMMYLFGVRHFVLTSTSIDALDHPANTQDGTFGGRLIAIFCQELCALSRKPVAALTGSLLRSYCSVLPCRASDSQWR
jgi:hypothetical protein